jgi:uncharacterized membrane protein
MLDSSLRNTSASFPSPLRSLFRSPPPYPHRYVVQPGLAFPESAARKTGRWVFAALLVTAGTLHFMVPEPYLRIMPPLLPHPLLLVWISGAAEIAGGLGLLLKGTRRAAAWGLIAMLVAVAPANIYMAMAHVPFPGIFGHTWAQWLRVPLQLPLIAWAWIYTRD